MDLLWALIGAGLLAVAIAASFASTRRRLKQLAVVGAVILLIGGFVLSPDCGDGSECVSGYVFAILLVAGWEIGLAAGAAIRWVVRA